MNKIINTADAPVPFGPYSQAVSSSGFIFSSGQIAMNPVTGELVLETIESETKQVLANIKALLVASGLEFTDIVSTCIYLKNMDNFAKVNSIYSTFFTSDFPARTTVEVARLPKDVNVEISFIASAQNGS